MPLNLHSFSCGCWESLDENDTVVDKDYCLKHAIEVLLEENNERNKKDGRN